MSKLNEISDDKSEFSSSDFSLEEQNINLFNVQQENERLKKRNRIIPKTISRIHEYKQQTSRTAQQTH